MFHNIRILAEHHNVRVITFFENEQERELVRSLEDVCESVTAVQRVPDFSPHWLSLSPFLVREFSTPRMHETVAAAFQAKKVDVLQCEYLQMAQYWRRQVFTILTIIETAAPNVYDAFRRETNPLEKLRLFYRWMSVMRYEVLQSRKFDRVVTMTEHDANYLRSYTPGADIRSIPIGIDANEFTPRPEVPDLAPQVLFLGNFRHTPNLEAAEFLVRRIAPEFPELKFTISGPNLEKDLNPAPNVVLAGFVEDTRILYRRPQTIVATPLFSGTGQRVKLLEAFAMGCPVITSSIGALGYPIRNGVDALIADTAEDFAAALRRLIASPELRRQLGANGREMILRHFTWRQLGAQFLALVEGAPHSAPSC